MPAMTSRKFLKQLTFYTVHYFSCSLAYLANNLNVPLSDNKARKQTQYCNRCLTRHAEKDFLHVPWENEAPSYHVMIHVSYRPGNFHTWICMKEIGRETSRTAWSIIYITSLLSRVPFQRWSVSMLGNDLNKLITSACSCEVLCTKAVL